MIAGEFNLVARLKKCAELESTPFCYSCYQKAPSGRCSKCRSDDLMRIMSNDGPEYSGAWQIDAIVQDVPTISADEMRNRFESHLDDCYPMIEAMGFSLEPSLYLKRAHPFDFELWENDFISGLIDDGSILDIGGRFYENAALEKLCDEIEQKHEESEAS